MKLMMRKLFKKNVKINLKNRYKNIYAFLKYSLLNKFFGNYLFKKEYFYALNFNLLVYFLI